MSLSSRDIDDARLLFCDLENVFQSCQPGRGDAAKLEEVRRLCLLLAAAMGDAYCRNVLRAIEGTAACLFDDIELPESVSEDASLRRLIRSLLAALDGRLSDLDAQVEHSRDGAQARPCRAA